MKLYRPSPEEATVIFADYEGVRMEAFAIDVGGQDYMVCEEHSKKRWSNKKTGFYGSGIMNTDEDPYRVERIGLLGEVAFGKIFDWPVDLTYRKGGDKNDFQIGDISIDVKTSFSESGKSRVLHTNSRGKKVISYKDLYVVSFLDFDYPDLAHAAIIFVGYVTRGYLEDRSVVPAPHPKATHLNQEILFQECSPMEHLLQQKLRKFPNRNPGSPAEFLETFPEA